MPRGPALGFLRDAVEATEATEDRAAYIQRAQTYKARDGQLEIDDDAVVVRVTDEPSDGAYVAARVWIDAEDIKPRKAEE